MGASSGGLNRFLVYRSKKKSDGTGYDFLDKLTDTVVAAPTPANAAIVLELTEETKPDFQDDNTIKYSLTQYESGKGFWAFRNKVCRNVASGTVKQVTLENGKKIFGGASGDKCIVICEHYYDDPSAPTEVFVSGGIGTIAKTSGSFSTKDSEGVKPSLEFTGETAEADLVIPATAFPSGVTGVATTIPKDIGYFAEFFDKAA